MTIQLLFALVLALVGAQDPHAQMNHRGAEAMGFDQDKTAHHFRLFADGGAIEVVVKDAKDKTNLDAIRAHLPHIAQRFGMGDFSAPMFIHGENVPGSDVMKARAGAITYRYEETPAGGRVRLTTTDAEALAAVHRFMRYQITEHRTGDSLDVTRQP